RSRRSAAQPLDPTGIAALPRIRAADEGVALDEDRLATAEAVRLCLAHRPIAERLEVGVPFPQALLEAHHVAVDAEARAVEGGLGVEPVVDERRDELHVRLGLDEAAHHAEGPEQRSVAEEHARDDRVVGTTPWLDGTADGEAGAAVLQDDAGAG